MALLIPNFGTTETDIIYQYFVPTRVTVPNSNVFLYPYITTAQYLAAQYPSTVLQSSANAVSFNWNSGTETATITTQEANVFGAGDVVSIVDAPNRENNGVFEVASHVGTLLTLRKTVDFVQKQVATDSEPGGLIRRVTLQVLRAAAGVWSNAVVDTTEGGVTFNFLVRSYVDSGGGTSLIQDNFSLPPKLRTLAAGTGLSLSSDGNGLLTYSLTSPVSLANGGSNASLTAVNGGVAYSTTTALALTAAGTSGQVLTSNGAAAPTWQNPSTANYLFTSVDDTGANTQTTTNGNVTPITALLLTATVAGTYSVDAELTINDGLGSGTSLTIQKNGSSITGTERRISGTNPAVIHTVVALVVDDELQVTMQRLGLTNVNFRGGSIRAVRLVA